MKVELVGRTDIYDVIYNEKPYILHLNESYTYREYDYTVFDSEGDVVSDELTEEIMEEFWLLNLKPQDFLRHQPQYKE